MNIGNLRIAVKIADGSLKTAIDQVQVAFRKAGTSIEQALNGKSSEVFKKIKKEAEYSTKTIGGLNNRLRILKNSLEGVEIGSKEFKKLQKEIKKTEKQLRKATGETSGFLGVLKRFGPALAGIFSIAAISNFTKSLFNLTSRIEQVKISFKTLLGSAKEAENLFNNLTIFAAKTPFNRLKLTEQTQKLLGFGFAGKQVLPIMKSLGDAVAAVGGNQETLDGIILALGQIKAKGKLSAEELMQMAERGLPVFEILEKKLGLTKEQIGNIGNEAISANEAIPALLEGLNEKFAGAMEAQSQTLAGKWSNMVDNIEAKMSELGAKLSPFFGWIIDKISAIIIPILIILGKIVDGFIKSFSVIKANFNKFKTFFKKNLDKIQAYFDKFLQIFVSTFVGALVFIKRATIKEFIQGTIAFIVSGFKKSSIAVINFTKAIIPNTIAIIKNTLAKTYNTIASIKLTRANLIASLSFKKLGKSIVGTTKRLIFLIGRFFFIATIVAMVVLGIYKNWDKLKKKLKPIFEYIGKIGQKAPEIIADAWNMLVDAIAWTVKSILGTTEKLINAINKIPGVNIDTSGIKNAVKAVDDFAKGVKIDAKDVKSAFDSIKDGAKGLLDDFGDTGLGDLNDEVFDIKSNFADLGDEAEQAGDKASAGAKKAKEKTKELEDKIKDLNGEYKDLEKQIKKLEDIEDKYNKKSLDYKIELKQKLKDIGKEIDNNREKYNKLLSDIEKEKSEKIGDIEKDKNKSIAERILELENDLPDLEKELKQKEKQYKKDSKKHTFESKEEYNKHQEKLKEELKEITALKAKIEKAKKELEIAKSTVDKNTLDETRKYNSLTETEKILYNANKAKEEAEKEAKDKLIFSLLDKGIINKKEIEDFKKKTLKEITEEGMKREQKQLEEKARIVNFFQQKERVTDKDIIKLKQNEKFMALDKEKRDFILSLATKKAELTKLKDEEIKIQKEIANQTIILQNKVKDVMLKNIDEIHSKYKDLLNMLDSKIGKKIELNAVGNVNLPSQNIPQNVSNSKNINNQVKIEINNPVVRNNTDVDEIAEKVTQKTLEKLNQDADFKNKNYY